MAAHNENLRSLLDSGDFAGLLIGHLGWDNPPIGNPPVRHEDDGTEAVQVAGKRGVGVWVVDGIPAPPARRRLDSLIARRTRERLVIFATPDLQLWLWPEQRQSGAGFRLVAHEHHVGSRNDALLQRLAGASFTLDEEAHLTVIEVLERVRRSFNAEKVTKRFYKEFKAHRDGLLGQIEGIRGEEQIAWYGSVLLNRLMLVYFLQKKGFLDDDPDYLNSRLAMVREHLGADAFFGFFRDFLLPLFHDGLGSHRQDYGDPLIADIVGDVPYVNGGIFLEHPLESFNEINVPDSAFEAIFSFFDKFRWHLDERPTDDPNEINPDVLGYVFEQYVNSKEAGAYYTKEDVTGYMTSVTVLPALLDRLDLVEGEPWVLLEVDPDRYIFDSIRHGVDIVLPPEIRIGLDNEEKRDSWWEKAAPEFGLPGENWWEVVDRRRHYTDLRVRLEGGTVRDVSACITDNLDIRRLVEDHLDQLPDIESVKEAWNCLNKLTVLDPTCGSGAFLFAALEILADLYTALIDRAVEFVEKGAEKPAFLTEAERHPNLRYFVLRSVQLNNLYGVDIMAEAGEIARLRLFLKLAAQLEHRDQIEPFPDLDLNIKCGNLLVGMADREDVEKRFGANVFAAAELERIEGTIEASAGLYLDFVKAQSTNDDPEEIRALKQDLLARLTDLRADLDRILYGIRAEAEPLAEWAAGHQPFHWFVEFPQVFRNGGFDVVVGNPPYVKRSKIDYSFLGFETNDARDIFAPCMERSVGLVSPRGWYSMVVPIAFQFSDGYSAARRVISDRLPARWASTYSRNPSALFSAGVGVRSSIVVGARMGEVALRTTCLRRWWEEGRSDLFATNLFVQVPAINLGVPWPRPGRSLSGLFTTLVNDGHSVGEATRRTGPELGFKQTALYYVSVFIDEPPAWTPNGARTAQTMVGWLRFVNEEARDIAFLLLAGRLSTWWWGATGDDFDVTAGLLSRFPIGPGQLEAASFDLRDLAVELRAEQQRHPLVTKYAGKEMGNYDMSLCRHITDKADELVLETLGYAHLWPEVMLADSRLQKATGERPGTRREWPFPL
ncbi:MAG: SAM-dependent methyltransferase [Gemmatimonadales bacterium]|nr:SAM-dependent methyltransferase [Gemmatimonadales bacterium]